MSDGSANNDPELCLEDPSILLYLAIIVHKMLVSPWKHASSQTESNWYNRIRAHGPRRYIKSIVYGASDGIISMFCIVTSCFGANISPFVMIIICIANLVADALSMAVSDYVGSQAELQAERQLQKEVKECLTGERDDVGVELLVAYFKSKGHDDENAQALAAILMKNQDHCTELLFAFKKEESELEEDMNPSVSALWTFLSFCLFGGVPILSWITFSFVEGFTPLRNALPFLDATTFVVTAVCLTLTSLGSVQAIIVYGSKVTGRQQIESGVKVLLVGGLASLISFFVTNILSEYTEGH